jgi:hypothetical protein
MTLDGGVSKINTVYLKNHELQYESLISLRENAEPQKHTEKNQSPQPPDTY